MEAGTQSACRRVEAAKAVGVRHHGGYGLVLVNEFRAEPAFPPPEPAQIIQHLATDPGLDLRVQPGLGLIPLLFADDRRKGVLPNHPLLTRQQPPSTETQIVLGMGIGAFINRRCQQQSDRGVSPLRSSAPWPASTAGSSRSGLDGEEFEGSAAHRGVDESSYWRRICCSGTGVSAGQTHLLLSCYGYGDGGGPDPPGIGGMPNNRSRSGFQ